LAQRFFTLQKGHAEISRVSGEFSVIYEEEGMLQVVKVTLANRSRHSHCSCSPKPYQALVVAQM